MVNNKNIRVIVAFWIFVLKRIKIISDLEVNRIMFKYLIL